MKNASAIVQLQMRLEEAIEVQRRYIGKIRLLRAIMGSLHSGAAKTWEQSIDEVLETLSPRENKVLRLRFGLDGNKPQDLETVGRQFGVTRERIRQLEAKAIRKLKHPSRKRVILGESWQMAVQEAKAEGVKLIKEYQQLRTKPMKQISINPNPNDELMVDELNLPTRVINALYRANIDKVGVLRRTPVEMLETIKGLGKKAVIKIQDEVKRKSQS